jgi:hypothetical protein
MRTLTVVRIAAALAVSAVVAMPTVASAKKRISYEQAFKRCKAYIDKEKGGLAHSTTNEATRFARGSACMRKFGYRI